MSKHNVSKDLKIEVTVVGSGVPGIVDKCVSPGRALVMHHEEEIWRKWLLCSHQRSNSLEQKATQYTLDYLKEDKIPVHTQNLFTRLHNEQVSCSQKKKRQFESQIQ